MDRLKDALGRHTSEIEAGLQEAYTERDELRVRERALTELIERAEASLGSQKRQGRLTLHEAMAEILRDGGNQWMHTRELATEVNRRLLYQKRDGSPVESNQIHARAKNYSHLFEKESQRVRLRTEDETDTGPRPRSKYDTLREYLSSSGEDVVELSFDQIGDLVGPLPQSAWDHPAWWANEASGSHVQARSWMGAGFRVFRIDQEHGWVRFRRGD